MNGYEFHSEAQIDLDIIWDFIAEDNIDAADRLMDDIEATIEGSYLFPTRAIVDKTRRTARCVSQTLETISSLTLLTKGRYGLWLSCTETAALALWLRS